MRLGAAANTVHVVELLGSYSNPLEQVKRLRRVLAAEREQGDVKAVSAAFRPGRQVQRRLTADQVDDLVLAYEAGASVPGLAAEFGVDRTTVLRQLDKRGVPRRASVRKLTNAQVRVMAQRYRAGASVASLAREFEVNPETVRKELRQMSVELRRSRKA